MKLDKWRHGWHQDQVYQSTTTYPSANQSVETTTLPTALIPLVTMINDVSPI